MDLGKSTCSFDPTVPTQNRRVFIKTRIVAHDFMRNEQRAMGTIKDVARVARAINHANASQKGVVQRRTTRQNARHLQVRDKSEREEQECHSLA